MLLTAARILSVSKLVGHCFCRWTTTSRFTLVYSGVNSSGFLAILGLVVGVGTRLATLAYVSFFGGGGEVYWGKVSSFPFGASADKLFTFSLISAISRSPTTFVLSSTCLVFESTLADRSRIAWPWSSIVLVRVLINSMICWETLLKCWMVSGVDLATNADLG
jgi:hypothetical protein